MTLGWLTQEWEEARGNLLDHITIKVGQDLSGRFSLPGSVVEHYLDGEVEVHVHWSSGIDRSDEIPRDCCARCAHTKHGHRVDPEVVAAKAHSVLDGIADRVKR